ncbi:hypothetical protein K432DRAFT_160736 [Lepidopterella palustris CBS 459.81]|uniref:Uncharacterized protein n=1 Tax=Lepidopterella palustris CBS 459.81 TaxID=1314670 RepID=A0A8E2E220_9PEZI|nr:hypothetical protein K432DRAFT_160736 [Lepidopterella palustris CBS 459.81]
MPTSRVPGGKRSLPGNCLFNTNAKLFQIPDCSLIAVQKYKLRWLKSNSNTSKQLSCPFAALEPNRPPEHPTPTLAIRRWLPGSPTLITFIENLRVYQSRQPPRPSRCLREQRFTPAVQIISRPQIIYSTVISLIAVEIHARLSSAMTNRQNSRIASYTLITGRFSPNH